jgi:hypothetical protein
MLQSAAFRHQQESAPDCRRRAPGLLPKRFVDAACQISVFVKLKLTKCAPILYPPILGSSRGRFFCASRAGTPAAFRVVRRPSRHLRGRGRLLFFPVNNKLTSVDCTPPLRHGADGSASFDTAGKSRPLSIHS